ncbi:hypothetical protein R3P38DRAFT_3620933 [Favolaschia claudopus]|uniref:Uncharacterized protein n=1 Tax=Favolaschia claudopus TaxID=2862362 RepID=A0AAW0A290_9AGAR
MGRKSKPLDPETQKLLEYHPSDAGRVRCQACINQGKSALSKWISLKSLPGHLSSAAHQSAVENQRESERRQVEEATQLTEPYTADAILNAPAAGPITASNAIPMFPEVPSQDVEMESSGDDMPMSELIAQVGQGVERESFDPEANAAFLRQEYETLLMRAVAEEVEGGLNDQFIADELPKTNVDEDEDDDDCVGAQDLDDSELFPYTNETVCDSTEVVQALHLTLHQIMHLDIADNLLRCRFSDDQLRVILHLLKKLEVQNVPSLKHFRRVQERIQNTLGGKPVKSVSASGNIFYTNDIRETIARDMSNPLVAPHLHLYPEETTGPISETYQAKCWKEYTPSQLTPMFSRGRKQFWLDELTQLSDASYVIPLTWIVRDGVLTSDVLVVKRTPDGHWMLTNDFRRINADDFDRDFIDLQDEFGQVFRWVEDADVPPMPNPLRQLVDDDEDLVVVMVSPWADDVSGNRSKQYNKHMNMCTGNGCLPGRLLQQEYHLHYISTSPHASSAEQFATFRDQVKATETEPVKCFNAASKRKCAVILRCPGLPGDNPQQSDEASHIGCNANYPCRKCRWGGTKIEKESEEIFHNAHLAGVARNAADIKEGLQQQLKLAVRGDAKAITALQRDSGTKDKITQYWIDLILKKYLEMVEEGKHTLDEIAVALEAWLEAQPGDKMNPLLDITGLDPSQDTPVELLHTILLGVLKYIWHLLNTKQWSDTDRYLLAIRLQSTDISGLTIPAIRAGYMIQYRNNLIGKHFKTLMQILLFHVHDICTPEQFVLIKAASALGARLWVPEIDNMEEYLKQLQVAVANLLDAFDAVDPLRILVKVKLHLLTHLPDDIRRFGPGIRFATEIYEGFNTVFRLCSVMSNRLAPSRDISSKFASMARVKHLISGGYWKDPTSNLWMQAGPSVQRVLRDDPVFQRHFGWTPPQTITPGVIHPVALRHGHLRWSQTTASTYWKGDPPSRDGAWRLGRDLTAQSGDKVKIGGWVVALDSANQRIFGRVKELLVGQMLLVTLERFVYTERLHADFDLPVLRRPNGTEIIDGIDCFIVLAASSVQFICSVMHDCRTGKCQPKAVQKERQEREETDRDISLIIHSDHQEMW